MFAAMVLFVIHCQSFAGVMLFVYHNELCRLSREYRIQEKFNFQNIFWPVVICLLLIVNPGIVVLGLKHIIRYVFQASGMKMAIYIFFFCVIFFMFCCDLGIGLFFAVKKYGEDKIIKLADIMEWCQYIQRHRNTCNIACTQLCQFLAIFTLLFSSLILPILIYGVILAALIHPLRVGLITVATVSFMITFIILLIYIFEQNDHSPNQAEDNRDPVDHHNYSILKTFLWLLLLVTQLLFIGFFSAVYVNIILFNDLDKTGVLNLLSQLFPAALFLLVIKKEYDALERLLHNN